MTHPIERARYYVEAGAPMALVLRRGAYVSLIRYSVEGIQYEVYADNSDLMFEKEEED